MGNSHSTPTAACSMLGHQCHSDTTHCHGDRTYVIGCVCVCVPVCERETVRERMGVGFYRKLSFTQCFSRAWFYKSVMGDWQTHSNNRVISPTLSEPEGCAHCMKPRKGVGRLKLEDNLLFLPVDDSRSSLEPHHGNQYLFFHKLIC